jgi:hypothetical protein
MLISNTRFLFYFLLILTGYLISGKPVYCTTVRPVIPDSSIINQRTLSPEKKKELLNDSDYMYDRIGPEPESLWQRFKNWFWRKVASIFTSKEGDIGIKILEYGLMIAAIVVIILLLLKNNIRSLFYGKAAAVHIDYSEFEEHIDSINFDEMIQDSVSKKDYRKAIRLHFLKLLKGLSDRNLIQWKIDKTNNDYSIELNKSKYSNQFRELASLYEYVWYGDFKLEEEKYTELLKLFKEFRF